MFVQIEGYENYSVDRFGNVRNNKTGLIRKQQEDRSGYKRVNLHSKGTRKWFLVHRLVAAAFIPNLEGKPYINHKDGNKNNNHISNLEWVTAQENNIHAIENGLREPVKGEDVHWAKITNEQVHKICKLLQDGKTVKEVERLTGVHYKTISNIKTKKRWCSISDLYKFGVVRQTRLSKEIVRSACELFEAGYKVTDSVVTELGISYQMLNNIYNRVYHKDVSDKYKW